MGECHWYVWVGQSFAYCDGDGCDKPAWEHDGERVPTHPFGATPDRLRPWKPGQAEAIRRKWGAGVVAPRKEHRG